MEKQLKRLVSKILERRSEDTYIFKKALLDCYDLASLVHVPIHSSIADYVLQQTIFVTWMLQIYILIIG